MPSSGASTQPCRKKPSNYSEHPGSLASRRCPWFVTAMEGYSPCPSASIMKGPQAEQRLKADEMSVSVLVGVTVAVMKHDQKPPGRKGLTLHVLLGNNSSFPQGWMQRPWRALFTGLFLMACSVCFLIDPRAISPGQYHPQRAVPSHINW